MIPLLKHYQRSLAWFVSGLVIAVLLSLGTLVQQPATALNQSQATPFTQPSVSSGYSDFAASHLEPNFYQ